MHLTWDVFAGGEQWLLCLGWRMANSECKLWMCIADDSSEFNLSRAETGCSLFFANC